MRDLLRIVAGVIIGFFLFAGVESILSANEPRIEGHDGVLSGVEVVDRDGNRICEDPAYMKASKTISCE